jgi:hypothetical protein
MKVFFMSRPPLDVGIDIGADRIHVATSYNPRAPINVIQFDMPNWSEQLIALIPARLTVASAHPD